MSTQVMNKEEQVPAWVLDLLLGIAVVLVIALVISARQGGRQDPDLIAYLFACGFGALMLVRRRFPVAVLIATMVMLCAYYILDYPAIGLAVPVAAALYSAAELGRLSAAIGASIFMVVSSNYFRIQEGQDVTYLLGYELIWTVALMAAVIALGDSIRSRRSLRAEQEQTARLIEQEHALRAEQRVQAERVRMARDLHDTIGHSISVISLHADVAREAIGCDDEQARQALAQVRATSSETMRELRATVRLLRSSSGEQPDRSTASLTNLAALVQNASASGLQVNVHIEGEVGHLPGAVDVAAFRIVQEALTNIIRHANANRVDITIGVAAGSLRLQIADNGIVTPRTVIPGSGITGMSERARLLGGTLVAEAQVAGGFTVQATLPLEDVP